MTLAWVADAFGVAYSAVLGALCVYGLHRCFLAATYLRVRRRCAVPVERFASLPRVTVQLPIYNEPFVARRVIEAACNVDYPADRLEVQVLDDSTDETRAIVAEAVARLRAAGRDVVHLHRPCRTGFKAGALAEGARRARGEFIAIFDADFIPPRDVLRETIHHFTDPRVGMVQCRWEHLNREDSLLTQAQAILLDGHFLIEHTARNRTGRFMSFNGTAGVWRKAAIEDAGGWQHDTLTEDLDLSYRAQLRGWRFVFLPAVAAPAELPPEMNAFKSQQHRWTKGGAQTCVKLLPRVLADARGWRVKLEAFFHLTSGVVYVLMVLLSMLIGPALIARLVIDEPTPPARVAIDLLLFTIGTGSALSFYVVSQRELLRGWSDTLRYIPALMAIGVGIALNNAVAAVEGALWTRGEFVRTPKFGAVGTTRAVDPRATGERPRAPASPRGAWKAWAEIGLSAYLAACLGALFLFDEWFERVSAAIPFMALFIFGYAYVGIQSLRARAPRWAAPAPVR